MIIMFMIAATTAVGSTATILLGAFCLLDSHTQLRTDLIIKREKHDTLANRLANAADKVGSRKLSALPCYEQYYEYLAIMQHFYVVVIYAELYGEIHIAVFWLYGHFCRVSRFFHDCRVPMVQSSVQRFCGTVSRECFNAALIYAVSYIRMTRHQLRHSRCCSKLERGVVPELDEAHNLFSMCLQTMKCSFVALFLTNLALRVRLSCPSCVDDWSFWKPTSMLASCRYSPNCVLYLTTCWVSL